MLGKFAIAIFCVVTGSVAQENGYGRDVPRRGLSYDLENSKYRYDEGDGATGGEIPGEPDKDYPVFRDIPETRFDCNQQGFPGYYADPEARCQVFHICQRSGRRDSFLCPNGTLFNQETLVCDWWTNFECDRAPSLYSVNEAIVRSMEEADRITAERNPAAQGYNYKGPINYQNEENRRGENGPRSDFDTVVVEAARTPSANKIYRERVTRPIYDLPELGERQRAGSYDGSKKSKITEVEFKKQGENFNDEVSAPAQEYLPGRY